MFLTCEVPVYFHYLQVMILRSSNGGSFQDSIFNAELEYNLKYPNFQLQIVCSVLFLSVENSHLTLRFKRSLLRFSPVLFFTSLVRLYTSLLPVIA